MNILETEKLQLQVKSFLIDISKENSNKKNIAVEIKEKISDKSEICDINIGENQENLLMLIVKENMI
jgi:uncharacterized protein YgfB (UPF0149 family)